jgi:prepilin-type N-terminal cleavage/methylation domain-containing protein
MFFKKAFTLLEILLVIAIITLAVTITYPSGVKILERFNAFLEKVEKKSMEKKKRFEKFLNDE